MGTLLILSFFTGLILGLFRYWIGFFVVGHAFFGALAVTWIASSFYHADTVFRPREGAVFVVTLLAGEVLGFGLSQPWFDPFGWALRVFDGQTVEGVFGIALLGGAVGKSFLTGADGGFWLFFNLIDLFFLWLFMMFGLNTFIFKEKR